MARSLTGKVARTPEEMDIALQEATYGQRVDLSNGVDFSLVDTSIGLRFYSGKPLRLSGVSFVPGYYIYRKPDGWFVWGIMSLDDNGNLIRGITRIAIIVLA